MKKVYTLVLAVALFTAFTSSVYAEANTAVDYDSVVTSENLVKATSEELVFIRDIPMQTRVDTGETTYKREAVTLVPENAEESRKIQRMLEEGEHPLSGTDNSISCRLYSTFYYKSKVATVQGITTNFYYISSDITGGYEMIAHDGTSVVSHNVLYSQTGDSEKTGFPVNQTGQSGTYSASKTSWRISVPSSWVAVSTVSSGQIGCSYFVKLKRANGTTWEYNLVNNL